MNSKMPTQRLVLLALVLGLTPLAASPSDAQSAALSPVRAGAVTGVEMQIEGAMSAPRGGSLSFALTAYDVLGLSELRPSPHATIRALSSLTPAEAAAEVEADANGRALIEIPIPDDAPSQFSVMLEMRSRARALRRFELAIQVTSAQRLSLRAAPNQARPGSRIVLFGRLERTQDAKGIAGRPVRISIGDGRGALGPEVTVRTNAFGLFELPTRVPEDARGALVISATVTHPTPNAPTVGAPTLNLPLTAASTPSLLVFVQAARPIVAPGSRLAVHVLVRRPDGRPLSGVQVSMNGSTREQDLRRTDARGRAELSWLPPARFHGSRQMPLSVSATRAGFGSAVGQTDVLLTVKTVGARASFEGATLSPELGGDVLVRVGRSDGESTSGMPVRLRLADGRTVEATADGDGAALLPMPAGLHVGDGTDGCGGAAATATLEVGTPAAYSHELCIPLDPDATSLTRLTHYMVAPGQDLEVHLRRTRAASRLPLVLTAFRFEGSSLRPFATQVLTPTTNEARITTPSDYVGAVLLRTRALFGAQHQEVRGSSVMAQVMPQPGAASLRSSTTDQGALQFSVHATRGQFARLAVLPLAQARALFQTIGGEQARPFSEIYTRAELALRTPRDRTAPAALRLAHAVAMPTVGAPETEGVLRDPWRARSRFTEGRLGLIFRALESRLDQAVPGDLDSVAVRERGRLRLNEHVLESLGNDGGLGAEGATGLGGEPLVLSTLQRLDRDFDYDAVARRLTRRRLFRVLIGMREFVKQRDFDLPWARLGEPELWLRNMAEEGMELPDGESLDVREFIDGWGNACALMRSTRGGPLAPVQGYAVVSAGPDGRFGTRDDLSDPTARVLRSGGLYAQAVGEEDLLARLSGVEVARATLRSVAELFGMDQPVVSTEETTDDSPVDGGTLPEVARPDAFALALLRPRDPVGLVSRESFRLDGSDHAVVVDAGSVPRPVGAVLEVFGSDGQRQVQLAEAFAGGDLLADAVLPTRLRAGEHVRAQVHLTNLSDHALDVRAALQARGLQADAPAQTQVPAGESRELSVELEATGPGDGTLTLGLGAGERAMTVVQGLRVSVGDLPLAIAGTAMTDADGLEFTLEPPADARGLHARLVVVTPRALWRDPAVARLGETSPGLYAFSMAMSGDRLSPELRARLLRAETGGLVSGRDSLIETAAGLVAVSSLLDDEQARAAGQRMANRLTGELGRNTSAAAVAALATRGVVSSAAEESEGDALSRALSTALPGLRRVLRDLPEDNAALARAAAALLLADPTDLHGLSMLRIARSHLVASGSGQLLELTEAAGHAEQAAATLALSLAAWQAGDRELAAALVRGALRYEGALLGGSEEQQFWLLASAGYGAMGDPGEAVMHTRIDGTRGEASMTDGAFTLDVPVRPGRRSEVEVTSDAALLTRLEASYDRALGARAGPLALSLRGDSASLDERGLFELTVRASREIHDPIVEFSLPASADLDDTVRQALIGNAAVANVELREGGVVRLSLRALSAGQTFSIPLPLRFVATGSQRGLGMLAFPSDEPSATSVLPARVITVSETEDAG